MNWTETRERLIECDMIDTNTPQVKALLIQPRGKDGGSVYTVYWQDERGRERHYTTQADEFWAIHERAGDASYTEPGYWTYDDNRAIEWDDVLPPRTIGG